MMPTKNYTTTDRTIRKTLLHDLKKVFGQNSNTAIIPELSLPNGLARIDIAVVNGIMHGYELKSDFDNLLRLQNQMIAYNFIFDRITLVVGKRHLVNALHIIPEWWGITIARTENRNRTSRLIPIREAVNNPKQNMHIIAHMLWKDEMLNILNSIGVSKNLNNKPKQYVCDVLVNSVDQDDLKTHVRKILISRALNSSYRSAEE